MTKTSGADTFHLVMHAKRPCDQRTDRDVVEAHVVRARSTQGQTVVVMTFTPRATA